MAATMGYAGGAPGRTGGGAVAQPRKRVTYTITTVTGDLPGAGTSANVYAQLHGTTADSKRFLLQSLGRKAFVRGQTDVFTQVEPDLGDITSLTIQQDGKSSFRERFASDWFLERVQVRAGASEWMFPCRRWLGKDQDDGQMKRTLYSRNAEAQIQYKVLTFTEDTPQAGTLGKVWLQWHAGSSLSLSHFSLPCLLSLLSLFLCQSFSLSFSLFSLSPSLSLPQPPFSLNTYVKACVAAQVWLQLHGDAGTAGGMMELTNPSLHDVFERGQKDLFLVRARAVGALNAVTVMHSNTRMCINT